MTSPICQLETRFAHAPTVVSTSWNSYSLSLTFRLLVQLNLLNKIGEYTGVLLDLAIIWASCGTVRNCLDATHIPFAIVIYPSHQYHKQNRKVLSLMESLAGPAAHQAGQIHMEKKLDFFSSRQDSVRCLLTSSWWISDHAKHHPGWRYLAKNEEQIWEASSELRMYLQARFI